MKAYETSATVEDLGQVRVAGVPFAPGTEVEVVISPKDGGGGSHDSVARAGRVERLLAALDKARNVEAIGGRFRRDDLYDRDVLR